MKCNGAIQAALPYGGVTFGDHSGFAAGGQGLYVPIFGLEGVLILLGDDAPTIQVPWLEGSSLVPMDQITIYDIHSHSFYLQNAGGQIPNPRTNFCAVGAGTAKADKSSWEM